MCKKYMTVQEWKQNNPFKGKPNRDLIRMCVIDDDGFSTKELESLGFNKIRVFDRYTDLDDFKSYNVILCDIKGIGTNLDQTEGIFVAKQIKQKYPDKIVLQYSGQSVLDYDKYYYENMCIDGFIEKSQSSKQLVDQLDKYCSVLWDPVAAWEFIEKNLRREKVNNINIAYFEDLYVKCLINNKNFVAQKKNNNYIKDIIKVIPDLISLMAGIIGLL